MMKKYKLRYLTSGLAAATMLLAYSSAFAAHTGGNVTLKDKDGVAITDGTTPYSPKQTCGGCHEYGDGTKVVTKNQGVVADDGQIYFQNYTVTSYEHGVSVGRHMNQGRNEEWTAQMRTVFDLPYFTSSPGMFGKF